MSAQHRLLVVAGVALLLTATGVLSYHYGARNATLRAKVGQLEKERAVAADTSAARAARVETARARADSAGSRAQAAAKAADDYQVSRVPVRRVLPVLQPANAELAAPLSELVDSLYRAIATRDTALMYERTARLALQKEVLALRAERPAHDLLVAGLQREIKLAVDEINLLKKAKTPRLGFRAGIIAGSAAVAGGILIAKKVGG